MHPENPKHIGVIMDGNRRWAKRHKLQSLISGHEQGAEKFVELCGWCIEEEIPHLSVYAFSTENWNRPEDEVDSLMRLIKTMFLKQTDHCVENNIRVRVVGNRELLSEEVRDVIAAGEERTRGGTALTVHTAISYGGRDEIVRAAKRLSRDALEGRISVDAIDGDAFAARLDMPEAPDIDLVVRTGGQSRLSNFFPWQSVYAELHFIDALWPDFSKAMFLDALAKYRNATVNHGK